MCFSLLNSTSFILDNPLIILDLTLSGTNNSDKFDSLNANLKKSIAKSLKRTERDIIELTLESKIVHEENVVSVKLVIEAVIQVTDERDAGSVLKTMDGSSSFVTDLTTAIKTNTILDLILITEVRTNLVKQRKMARLIFMIAFINLYLYKNRFPYELVSF